MLNFKYHKTLDGKYRVYLHGHYLGKVEQNKRGWFCDNPRDMGKCYKSRRAATMRLFVLDTTCSLSYN